MGIDRKGNGGFSRPAKINHSKATDASGNPREFKDWSAAERNARGMLKDGEISKSEYNRIKSRADK